MTTSRSSRCTERVLCLGLALCLGGSLPLHASPPIAAESKAAYVEGLEHYAAGHYAEAAVAFERAYTRKGNALILFNIGQCRRMLGDFPQALDAYRRYVELAGPDQPAETITEARGYVEQLQRYIEEERFRGARQERERAVAAERERVEQTEREQAARRAQLVEAERKEAEARAAEEARAHEAAKQAELVLASQAAVKHRARLRNPWLWTGVGAGVVVLGLAIGLGVGLTRAPDPSLGTITPSYPTP